MAKPKPLKKNICIGMLVRVGITGTYLLSQYDINMISLIGVGGGDVLDGNRWDESVKVQNVMDITPGEMKQLCGPNNKYTVLYHKHLEVKGKTTNGESIQI